MDELTHMNVPAGIPVTTHQPYRIFEPNALNSALAIIIIIIFCAYAAYVWFFQPSAEELEEFNDIMQYFHDDPNFDDFMKVYNSRNMLIRYVGRPVKFWLWGVYILQPDFYNDIRKVELQQWTREIERALRRVRTQPNAELLDCIWSLYFATGDQQYAEIIRRVAVDSTNIPVRNAARWSYRSIMKRGYQDPIHGTAADTTENPTDAGTDEPAVETEA